MKWLISDKRQVITTDVTSCFSSLLSGPGACPSRTPFLKMPQKIIVNKLGVPVVVDGEPRPLLPDSFIDWLEPRLNESMNVWEFGSGNSTLWFASKVNSVLSVEHHILWHKALISILPDNCKLLFIPLSRLDPYPEVFSGTSPQILLVDGMLRNECIHAAAASWTQDAVMIVDNTDTLDANDGCAWLRQQGFKEMIFNGTYRWATNGEIHSTSVFFKEGNCLGL